MRDLHAARGGLESAYGSTSVERRERLESVIVSVGAADASLESAGGAEKAVRCAAEGLDDVLAGRTPAPAQLAALEAIVLKNECPTLELWNDGFVERPSGRWKHLGDEEASLKPSIRAVGRLDCASLYPGYAGSGFLVGDGLLMTNRHVALQFAHYQGRGMYYQVDFDPLHEKRAPRAQEAVRVLDVVLIHPHWDIALLKVTSPASRDPLTLAAEPPQAFGGREVAVIGYPYFRFTDDTYERAVLLDNFGEIPGYKRLQPGSLTELLAFKPENRAFPDVHAMGHNASTLAGNSGSAVLDLETKTVVGVHFAGAPFITNWAVPTWELHRDPRLRDAGVRFTPASGGPPTPDPAVEAAWKRLEPSASAVQVPVHVGQESPAEPAGSFAWTSLDALTDAVGQGGPEARRRLIRALGDRQAAALLRALPAARSGEPACAVDPELPEIVLIHDAFTGHLDDVGVGRRRAWLSPKTFQRSLSWCLSLQQDGHTDAAPEERLEPAGPLPALYGTAAFLWRSEGFVVHELAFDWRKRIEVAADRLHFFLEALSAERPRRFALVAHGMGGLVACAYARRRPIWHERVQRAVLVGAPLGGTFDALQAALGQHPLQRKLTLLKLDDSPDELQRMALSFPGLLEMLPDPALFPSAAALYASSTWPGPLRPSQAALDRSRNLKALVRESPLLERAGLIASVERGTCDSLGRTSAGPGAPARLWAGPCTGPGDGVVPAASAIVAGLPLALVDEDHALMLAHDGAQRAVATLLREGSFPAELAREASAVDLYRRLEAPPEVVELHEVYRSPDPAEAATERLRRELDFDLVRWLFDASVCVPSPATA
ncbi:trypsin-like peptidase domain-containing protein [Sorangium sp. So ce385]|uniref:trypsin-like peptidase domain-containing protein n=1 Tax=Sorangium sp. So ce385 TaxID=3133308 RepID=UPI003F5B3B23